MSDTRHDEPLEALSWRDVFDHAPSPMLICDEAGHVLARNLEARRILGDGDLVLKLEARDTFSEFKMRRVHPIPEFFMADVKLEGAPISMASVTLSPMEPVGWRVGLVDAERREESAHVRLFRALGRVADHAPLFETLDELVPLLGSALHDAFPSYGVRLEVSWADGRAVYERSLGGSARADERDAQGAWRTRHVDTNGLEARLQVASRAPAGVQPAERDAFELFLNTLGFLCRRHVTQPQDLGRDILASVLNELHAVVALCDARRTIRACNLAMARAVGEGADALVGRDVALCFEDEARGAIVELAASAMSGRPTEPIEVRITLGTGAGRQVALSLHAAPLRDGDGFVLVGQVSQRELGRLEHELAHAEHMMHLGQLATGVAHELKNPLTSIVNYADYLLQKYHEELFDARDSERLERIIEGAQRMDRFIRDLVQLARPGAEDGAGRVDMHEVVREAVALAEVTLTKHGVRVSAELEAASSHVLGSHNQLVQVFVNLLINAALAMPEQGGRVRVRSWLQEGAWRVKVADTGQGIEPEHLEHVFEPFYTTRRGAGGSGLGLLLVRAITERHGGRVTVSSDVGEGTVFTLEVPLEST
ncbi:MAG: ATP-binding protein [Myxococcota bacterium]